MIIYESHNTTVITQQNAQNAPTKYFGYTALISSPTALNKKVNWTIFHDEISSLRIQQFTWLLVNCLIFPW